jgi:hypothetical protein
MQVYYDLWLFNPNTGYYFKTCHYQFNPGGPWYYFYIVCYASHPYYRNFFNRYPTVAQCEPYFPPFVNTPAHYPPDFQTAMKQLPSDLPTG